jgi:hypothetical protein
LLRVNSGVIVNFTNGGLTTFPGMASASPGEG